MPGLNQSKLIDFLARATQPDLVRSGHSEGVIVTVDPLMVHLDGVNAATPAICVGPIPMPEDIGKKALVVEVGGGKRYFLGVING